MFSALLRTRRAFGFTLAVSSGQELVTPAAAYARYALTLPETKVLALVLEAIRDAAALRAVLADAAARDIPVLLLAAGTSAASRSLVAAHSGALAAGDGAWQALASAYGVHRVGDLAELADTLELFSLTRAAAGRGHHRPPLMTRPGRAACPQAAGGIATVHDSGFERAHVADVAAAVGVPFAPLTEETRQRLAAVLDPGLEPGNPLDVWGTGRDSEALFTEALLGPRRRPGRRRGRARRGPGPRVRRRRLLPRRPARRRGEDRPSRSPCSPRSPPRSTPAAASRLRAAGVPVLESTRTGLLALRHLLAHAAAAPRRQPPAR